jgi:hypothetical protein
MSNKLNFANTINGELSKHMTECENYGITWGCDIDCPVLQAGNCELKNSDNAKLYKEFLNEDNLKRNVSEADEV